MRNLSKWSQLYLRVILLVLFIFPQFAAADLNSYSELNDFFECPNPDYQKDLACTRFWKLFNYDSNIGPLNPEERRTYEKRKYLLEKRLKDLDSFSEKIRGHWEVFPQCESYYWDLDYNINYLRAHLMMYVDVISDVLDKNSTHEKDLDTLLGFRRIIKMIEEQVSLYWQITRNCQYDESYFLYPYP
jgi:hypothetical protein